MIYNPEVHHRQSIRLRHYDYSHAGAYFVTICAWQRECLFGEVMGGEMRLNAFGEILRVEWQLTAMLRDSVALDEFIVMPNHFHAIISINDRRGTACRAPGVNDNKDRDQNSEMDQGTARRAPTVELFGRPVVGSLSTIIRSFKSAVTRHINQQRKNPGAPVWQRNYYERIIRDEAELYALRQYIIDNPREWADDENHPLQL